MRFRFRPSVRLSSTPPAAVIGTGSQKDDDDAKKEKELRETTRQKQQNFWLAWHGCRRHELAGFGWLEACLILTIGDDPDSASSPSVRRPHTPPPVTADR